MPIENGERPMSEQIEDERRRARRVRLIVDFTCAMIAQGRLPRRDAEQLVDAARGRILELFPGRDQTYEIVCAPRFRRVVDEFARPEPEQASGVVLAFRSRSSVH
jgi:hypothetical protein